MSHWLCPTCETFDGPMSDGLCDVCENSAGRVGVEPMVHLQAVLDYVTDFAEANGVFPGPALIARQMGHSLSLEEIRRAC